jgi:hypothetical protein
MDPARVIEECPERLRLNDEAALATKRVYDAAHAEPRELTYLQDLQDARGIESAALKALEKHRREHGC